MTCHPSHDEIPSPLSGFLGGSGAGSFLFYFPSFSFSLFFWPGRAQGAGYSGADDVGIPQWHTFYSRESPKLPGIISWSLNSIHLQMTEPNR